MNTLYNLSGALYALQFALEDTTDEETIIGIQAEIDALQIDYEVKAEGYVKVIKNFEAQLPGLEAEIKRLQDKKTHVENSIDRLKTALQGSMIATNNRIVETPLFKISIQKSPSKVVMDEQYIENIPPRFLIPQDPKLDKRALREAIEAGEVEACNIAHLEQGESLRIR